MDADHTPTLPAPIETSATGARKARASVSEKIATLKEQLAQAKLEAREAEKMKATIVGVALVAAMKDDAAFRTAAIGQLRTRVTNAREKAAIADFFL